MSKCIKAIAKYYGLLFKYQRNSEGIIHFGHYYALFKLSSRLIVFWGSLGNEKDQISLTVIYNH